jgi:magnesium chelatase subunit D
VNFSDFVGHEEAKLSLILNVIDPRCGGVIFAGEKGSGKSTLARLVKNLLPPLTPFVELPLNVTEDALLGGIDIEETIRTGKRIFQPGILNRADQGVIYIDDVNLLPPEIVALVLESHGRGENIVEREGLTVRQGSRFMLMATMNPEEAVLSPHFLDRFGMCVFWESLKEGPQKIAVIKKAMPEDSRGNPPPPSDENLKDKIGMAKHRLDEVIVPASIEDHIVQLGLGSHIAGHRGDLFLLRAARAYAAFLGEREVAKGHVDAVMDLVLGHRKRILAQTEDKRPDKRQGTEQDLKSEKDARREQEPKRQRGEKMASEAPAQDGSLDGPPRSRESTPKEEVFQVGNPFPVRRLVFRKDRVSRKASGRRTKTRLKEKSGRYVKSILKAKEDDVAIDATIRAAAPLQKTRGRRDILVVQREDLRFKQRERKMGHLVVFIVDGSGSMGAKRRMVETKAAIQSLLFDCYHKRDRVSLIVFRKDRAEVVLPPTSSVELASRSLRDLPVGGKTPLSSGLLQAYRLIKQVGFKEPQTRFLFVLITDGRANQSMTEAPVDEEIKKMTRLLGELKYTDYIVVDTENKRNFLRTDLALQIALILGADYYTIENLRSEYLTDMVQVKKAPMFGSP